VDRFVESVRDGLPLELRRGIAAGQTEQWDAMGVLLFWPGLAGRGGSVCPPGGALQPQNGTGKTSQAALSSVKAVL
jgi:hypothetical protein